MAISVDWAETKIIFVPKADMVMVQPPPSEVRELDLNTFRLTLRNLEDDPEGRPWPRTHDHDTEALLGGLLFARRIKILAPYTVTFEDGQYRVNAVGANSNIADVQNFNQVSVSTFNSAGLISVGGTTPEEIAAAVWSVLLSASSDPGTMGEALYFAKQLLSGRMRAVGSKLYHYADDNVTVVREFDLLNADGEPAETTDDVVERVPTE